MHLSPYCIKPFVLCCFPLVLRSRYSTIKNLQLLETLKQKNMSREIKFRAWLPSLNKMESSLFGLRSDGLLSFNDHDAVLMQYTGLKDKNGKEIYEGDFVQTVAKDGTRLSKFKIEWNPGCCGFTKEREDGNVFGLDNRQTLIEVIGNIYENPELLETKKLNVRTNVEQ